MDNDDAQECRNEMRRAADEWEYSVYLSMAGRSQDARIMRDAADRACVYALESLLAWVRA